MTLHKIEITWDDRSQDIGMSMPDSNVVAAGMLKYAQTVVDGRIATGLARSQEPRRVIAVPDLDA